MGFVEMTIVRVKLLPEKYDFKWNVNYWGLILTRINLNGTLNIIILIYFIVLINYLIILTNWY